MLPLGILLLLSFQGNGWQRPMESARAAANWEQMARICQAAFDQGVRDEYLVRSLSWAYCRAGNTAEGWKYAQLNWQINRGVWSLVNYIEAGRDHGELDKAIEAAAFLQSNQNEWGNLAKTCRDAIQSVSAQTYEIRWRIAPAAKERTVRIPIAQEDGIVQRNVTTQVLDAASWEFKTTGDGTRYVEARQRAGTDLWIVQQVTMRPHSWRSKLSQANAGSLPEAVRKYLGNSDYRGRKGAVDPAGPLARSLASQLRGANPTQTVENVFRYITTQVPWKDIPENGHLTSEGCLELKKGSCTPRSFAAIAILRAAGIPARAIRGHSAISPTNPHASAHTIPQFYLSGIGWMDADFDRPVWTPRTNFLRMYIRVGIDPILGDAMDPTKDCHVKLLKTELLP